MDRKLRSVDAHAVDLLLNRAAQAHQSGQPQSAFASHVSSSERLTAVEKVLGLLNVMQPAEPSPNLLAQTLSRVEKNTASPLGAPSHPMIDTNRPVA